MKNHPLMKAVARPENLENLRIMEREKRILLVALLANNKYKYHHGTFEQDKLSQLGRVHSQYSGYVRCISNLWIS